DFNVVSPKTQINTAGGATKPKPQPGIGGPISQPPRPGNSRPAVGSTREDILGAGLGNAALAGFAALSAPRPPNQAQQPLLPPAQLQKLANAGDPTSRFQMDIINKAAPR